MARTIIRVEARRRGEEAFIADAGGNIRNFLAAAERTTEPAFTADNSVTFPTDIDPLTDLDEIRFTARFEADEESTFSYFASEFLRYPFERLDQTGGFELRPVLDRGDTIEVTLSVSRSVLYFRSGKPLPNRAASPVSEVFAQVNRRPEPVRVGDRGTVHGVLPYAWPASDAYAGIFNMADRQVIPENDGRPLRYNTYTSVDEANMLIMQNPNYDPNIWARPTQIAASQFAAEPADILARKSALLIYATNFVDVAYAWNGVRSTWRQNREWPRFDIFDRSGYWYPFDVIPEKIKQAYADFAYELARENARLTASSESSRTGLQSLSVGEVSLTFDTKNNKHIIPDYIDVQLKEFYHRSYAARSARLQIPF